MRSRIWLISDLHLFHANIIRGGKIGIRPFGTLDEMHERIIDGWNSVVKEKDKVYVLGDLTLNRLRKRWDKPLPAWWKDLELLTVSLLGQKRLILGNHDHLDADRYAWLGFEKVLAYRELGGYILSHIPVHPEQFGRYKGNIHGHLHEAVVMDEWNEAQWPKLHTPDPRYLNVCVEQPHINYVPMLLDEAMARIEKGR